MVSATTKTEIVAGVTTFVTMAYIIFVQPAVLSTDFAGQPTGLDFGAVLLATCVVSGAATILMGLRFSRSWVSLSRTRLRMGWRSGLSAIRF